MSPDPSSTTTADAGQASVPDLEQLISDYCLGWHHPDPQERRRLITATLEADCLYLDPTVSLCGTEALLAHIDGIVAARPGFRLRRTSLVERHHDRLRFGWHAVLGSGRHGPESIDICRLSPAGRLAEIVGFFGIMKPL